MKLKVSMCFEELWSNQIILQNFDLVFIEGFPNRLQILHTEYSMMMDDYLKAVSVTPLDAHISL